MHLDALLQLVLWGVIGSSFADHPAPIQHAFADGISADPGAASVLASVFNAEDVRSKRGVNPKESPHVLHITDQAGIEALYGVLTGNAPVRTKRSVAAQEDATFVLEINDEAGVHQLRRFIHHNEAPVRTKRGVNEPTVAFEAEQPGTLRDSFPNPHDNGRSARLRRSVKTDHAPLVFQINDEAGIQQLHNFIMNESPVRSKREVQEPQAAMEEPSNRKFETMPDIFAYTAGKPQFGRARRSVGAEMTKPVVMHIADGSDVRKLHNLMMDNTQSRHRRNVEYQQAVENNFETFSIDDIINDDGRTKRETGNSEFHVEDLDEDEDDLEELH